MPRNDEPGCLGSIGCMAVFCAIFFPICFAIQSCQESREKKQKPYRDAFGAFVGSNHAVAPALQGAGRTRLKTYMRLENKWTDEWIPRQYQSKAADDVGGILMVDLYKETVTFMNRRRSPLSKSTFTLSKKYRMRLVDPYQNKTIAERSYDSTPGSGEVQRWVAEAWTRRAPPHGN